MVFAGLPVHQDWELQSFAQRKNHNHREGDPDPSAWNRQSERGSDDLSPHERHSESVGSLWQVDAPPVSLHFPLRLPEDQKNVENDKQPKFLP